MTDTPTRPVDRDAARQARLRDALRENLKRRKSQLRGRAKHPGTAADATEATDEADPMAAAAGPLAADQGS